MNIRLIENQRAFTGLLQTYVQRDGIDSLINYLENESDFFTAPCSTRYHGSFAGGLCEHSLNVYQDLLSELHFFFGDRWQERYSQESVVIVSLLHDLCKADKYELTTRNVKNPETKQWEEVIQYKVKEDEFALGHAPLSIHRITKHIKLTDEEVQAIHWHMGPYDLSQYNTIGQLSNAYRTNMLAFLLNRADMVSTYVTENELFRPIE